MNPRIFFILIISTIFISSCASTSEEVDYQNSSVTPPLEIPPDLISRSNNNNPSTTGKSKSYQF